MPGGLPGDVASPGHAGRTGQFCPPSQASLPAMKAVARTAIEAKLRQPAGDVGEMAHENGATKMAMKTRGGRAVRGRG